MSAEHQRGQQPAAPQQQQHEQEQQEAAAIDRLFNHADALPAILSFLPASSFAGLPAVSRALQAVATSNEVWRALALARWPAMGPMLDVLVLHGQSVRAFYRHRVQQLQQKSQQDSDGGVERRAAEVGRLQFYFEDCFLDVVLMHKTEGRVLASRLFPLDGPYDFEDEQVLAFFSLGDKCATLWVHSEDDVPPAEEVEMMLTLLLGGHKGRPPAAVRVAREQRFERTSLAIPSSQRRRQGAT